MSNLTINANSIYDRIIRIGRQTENLVSEITFNLNMWIEEYGLGECVLNVRRNGDGSAYPVPMTITDGLATWIITDTDTARKGRGEIQLVYRAGDKVKTSPIFTISCGESLVGDGEPPSGYEDWLAELGEMTAQVEAAKTSVSASAQAAQTAAGTAAEKASEAAQSAEFAYNHYESARQSAVSAQASKTGAIQAAANAHESATEAAQIATRIKNKFDTVNGRLTELEDNFPVVTGKQLIDKTKAVTGLVVNSGNVDTTGSYANYLTSAYIPVEAEKTYTLYRAGTVGAVSSTTRMVYCLFDSNKSVVSYFNNIVASVEISPATDGYLRVSMSTNGFTAQAMLIEGTTLGAYEEYTSETFLADDVNPINSKAAEYINNATSAVAGNILNGKKWVHCGDSFSAYTNAVFDDGVFVGKTKVFARLIGLRNGMVINDGFMKSGKTMAYPADGTFTNSLTCPTDDGYFQNIPSDTDYITIMLGINDLNHTNGSGTTPDGEDATGVITLGTVNDTTTATYCGAYNTVLGWLRENRPFAHVGIIVTNGTQRQDYTEAQITIAKKWGYPYINLNGDERTPAFIRCYNPNIPTALKDSLKTIQGVDAPSNTHPNWQTHKLESTIIEAWLRTL